MFASTDRLCAKDVMEEIGNEEQVLFHKAEMASKVDLQMIEYGCVFLWNAYATFDPSEDCSLMHKERHKSECKNNRELIY